MDERQKLIVKCNKTKYCKIYAAKRCKNWDFFLKVTAFTYNLALCIMSFLSIIYDNKTLGVIAAFLTLIVFATTLFITSLGYSEKANQHTKTVSDINVIISNLESGEIDIETAKKEYVLLMESCLGHENVDYVCYKYDYPREFLPEILDESRRDEILSGYEKEMEKNRKNYYFYRIYTFILKTVVTLGLYSVYSMFAYLVACLREACFRHKDNKYDTNKKRDN